MKARRLPVVDRVDRDGESVVMVDRTVIRLSPLATSILDETHEWIDATDLVTKLGLAFGPPPEGEDAANIVMTALHDMQQHGLIEYG